jgi:hypothetical protein
MLNAYSLNFFPVGILITNHNSPPITTPLEPCRVAPYVNVPSNIRASTAVTTTTATPSTFPTAATFSAFDPALLTAAHQVNKVQFDFDEKLIEMFILVCSSGHQQRKFGSKPLFITSISAESCDRFGDST